MRVVVAPDKFKGSLTAAEVADAVASGFLAVARTPTWCECLSLTAAMGRWRQRFPAASGGAGRRLGAYGRARSATYARHDHQAVVELAGVCGLDLLPGRRPDPLGASTYGLGQVLAHAITHGATDIVLGIGGSASTDGGAGMVQALGARLLDEQGRDLRLGGAAIAGPEQPRPDGAEADVGRCTNRRRQRRGQPPARSARGRCRVRPSEGASPSEVIQLDRALAMWAKRVGEATGSDLPRTGPAQVRPAAPASRPLALLNAELRPGIELLLDWLDFRPGASSARIW